MKPVYTVPQHGDLRAGYFYVFSTFLGYRLTADLAPYRPPKSAIAVPCPLSTKGWLRLEGMTESEITKRCSLDAKHGIGSRPVSAQIEVYDDPEPLSMPPLFSAFLGEPQCVSSRLAEGLSTSGLRGFVCERPEAIYDDEWDPPRKRDIFWIRWTSCVDVRGAVIIPSSENKCPFCGHGPLLCPACGAFPTELRCPQCRQITIAPAGEGGTEEDKRIPTVPGESIVEGHTWDGTDYWHIIATKRFVDFLLSVHAFPFVAEPILVDVSRMSKEQLKLLEEAKKLPAQ
jgi:hypothetical protein